MVASRRRRAAGRYLAVALQVQLERALVVVEAQYRHGENNVIPVHSLALLLLALYACPDTR